MLTSHLRFRPPPSLQDPGGGQGGAQEEGEEGAWHPGRKPDKGNKRRNEESAVQKQAEANEGPIPAPCGGRTRLRDATGGE